MLKGYATILIVQLRGIKKEDLDDPFERLFRFSYTKHEKEFLVCVLYTKLFQSGIYSNTHSHTNMAIYVRMHKMPHEGRKSFLYEQSSFGKKIKNIYSFYLIY